MKWEIKITSQGHVVGIVYTWAMTAIDAINHVEQKCNPNKLLFCYEARLYKPLVLN